MNKKVALVTGSSRGIGRAIALEFANQGYNLVINYKQNQAQAEEVLEQAKSAGAQGIIVQADVSDSKAAQELVDRSVEEFGKLDVLVNNAGINKDQLILRMSDDEWTKVIDTNLSAAFYCSRAALKTMIRKRYGRIINISSVVGLSGNAGQTHYSAAKSGLLGLSFSIAREYGNRGINANVVAPGYIQSDMTAELSSEQSARIMSGISAGRLGTPEDVAAVVAFLASPGADYINAQVIRVDGGMNL
jgi:3-oxoacyl-[acyl-carrier protein] reductase